MLPCFLIASFYVLMFVYIICNVHGPAAKMEIRMSCCYYVCSICMYRLTSAYACQRNSVYLSRFSMCTYMCIRFYECFNHDVCFYIFNCCILSNVLVRNDIIKMFNQSISWAEIYYDKMILTWWLLPRTWRFACAISPGTQKFTRLWLNCTIVILSGAVITRSNISRYYIQHRNDNIRTQIRQWTHKRHSMPRPNGRAMGCLLWGFARK